MNDLSLSSLNSSYSLLFDSPGESFSKDAELEEAAQKGDLQSVKKIFQFYERNPWCLDRVPIAVEDTSVSNLLKACAERDLRKATMLLAFAPELLNNFTSDVFENSPFLAAVNNDDVPMASLLFQAITNFTLPLKNEVLRFIPEAGSSQMVELLLQNVKEEDRDPQGNTLLHLLVKNAFITSEQFENFLKKYPQLVNHPNTKGDSPLDLACSLCQFEKAKILSRYSGILIKDCKLPKNPLQYVFDLYQKEDPKSDEMLLRVLLSNPKLLTHQYFKFQREILNLLGLLVAQEEIIGISILIEFGLDPLMLIPDITQKRSLLHFCCCNCASNVREMHPVLKLLNSAREIYSARKLKPWLNEQDHEGISPLVYAAFSIKNFTPPEDEDTVACVEIQEEVIGQLLEMGADPDLKILIPINSEGDVISDSGFVTERITRQLMSFRELAYKMGYRMFDFISEPPQAKRRRIEY